MNRATSEFGTIREYVRVFFRNKGKLVLYNVLVLLMAAGVLFFWPRDYRSEAKVWIKIGHENSNLDPTAATGETISIQESDREDEIKSVIDVLGCRGVIEGAVERLGPEVVLGDAPLPGQTEVKQENPVANIIKSTLSGIFSVVKSIDPIDDHEKAVQQIIKNLSVDAERKSNVVAVQYETDSPQLAQAVVAALVDEYKQEHARIHKTEGSKLFFGEQLETLEQRVETASEDLRSAKDRVGLASIEGHRRFLEQQMADVGAAELAATRKLFEANALVDELTRQLEKHPDYVQSQETSVPNTGRDTLRNQLYALQVQRMELEAKMNNHPLLDAIKKQEEDAERELAYETTTERTETTRAINNVHQQLALELARVKSSAAGHQATLDALGRQKKDVVNEIAELNRAEIEINRLERSVQLAVSNYMTYAENVELARISEELNQSAISNVSLAQAPTLEQKPVSPSKMMVAALALFAMFFGSAGIVAGMRLIDDSVRDRHDLSEVVEGPVVVSVPNQRQYRQVLR